MVSIYDMGLRTPTGDVNISVSGYAEATCGGGYPYVPPAGWKIQSCEYAPTYSGGSTCSYCAMVYVTIVPISPPTPPSPPPTLDINGCDTSIGETWCAARQECHIEYTDPCLPILPVTTVPPYIPPIVVTPLVEYPPAPECAPIENKAWECTGMTNYEQYDRYDCIDGKITFVEHNSTVCGYPEPAAPLPGAPAEGGIPLLYLAAGSAVLGIAALLLLRSDDIKYLRGFP